MPPVYVKPYLKRQKNDAADAEAICEAVMRPSMRFVATKTPEQQSCLMLHRTRHLFIRQQTAAINAIRAHLAEFGIVAPVGRNGVEELLDVVADPDDERVPEVARECLAALGAQLRMLKAQVLEFDRRILAWHRSNETSKQLDEIPGVSDRRPRLNPAPTQLTAHHAALTPATSLANGIRTASHTALAVLHGAGALPRLASNYFGVGGPLISLFGLRIVASVDEHRNIWSHGGGARIDERTRAEVAQHLRPAVIHAFSGTQSYSIRTARS